MVDIHSLVRPNIRDLTPYSSARDEFSGSKGIFLDANESPEGSLNRYPDPYQKMLKSKLSKIKSVSENRIFVGNGSDEVIDLVLQIFCQPNQDKVLAFQPSYGMYKVSAAIHGVEFFEAPLTQDFQIDREVLKPYLKNQSLKVIFLCSPNNPTGNVLNPDEVKFILDNFHGIVLVDEAYIDFAGHDQSMLHLLNDYKNLIISQTFSKAWALAGARVGMAFANEQIINYLNKVKPPYNVSELNQKAAITALGRMNELKLRISTILKERNRIEKELKQLIFVERVYPSEANFLLVKVKDADGLYKFLIKQNIIIRNRNTLIENCVRITVGTPSENDALLDALKSWK